MQLQEGVKSQDGYVRVFLASDGTTGIAGVTPITGKLVADITVYYWVAGATSQTAYSPIAGDWKESGQGWYDLNIGASEWTTEARYGYSVACAGADTWFDDVQVRDLTMADLMNLVGYLTSLTGTVAASPAPTTTAFSVTTALLADANDGGLDGAPIVFLAGALAGCVNRIATSVFGASTSALTLCKPLPSAPAAGAIFAVINLGLWALSSYPAAYAAVASGVIDASSRRPIRLVQNDTDPALVVGLVDPDTGLAIDLTTAASVAFIFRQDGASAYKFKVAATIVGARALGFVGYQWVTGDLDTAAMYQGEFEITWASGNVQTNVSPLVFHVRKELG